MSHTDVTHRKIIHCSNNLAEVTAQQHKVNLKNGEYICRLMSVNRVLLSNIVNNDIILCLFKHIIVVEI